MEFHQFFLPCLAHASYLVGDDGVAAVVDPQRDVEDYLEEASRRGLTITHVIETHLHADFVSGHLELAERTGATIWVSHRAQATFDHQPVGDGDVLQLGQVALEVLETPGHTPEGVCLLIRDDANLDAPHRLLTGDTLFIGDVGRPDLAGGVGFTSEDMAEMLYDTLHSRIATLPDETELYPAHGAGSACGQKMSSELSSTLGEQKRVNWALQPMGKEDFISALTTELDAPPSYFSRDAAMNREGAPSLESLEAPAPLDLDAFDQKRLEGAVVLDTRPAEEFTKGHVPKALWVGLKGQFASWCGSILPQNKPLLLIARDKEQLEETTLRLARVGIDQIVGTLDGGMEAWREAGKPVSALESVETQSLHQILSRSGEMDVLDVRQSAEHRGGHVPGAAHLPLRELTSRLDEVPPSGSRAVICATGYRSLVACSILLARGDEQVVNVEGGTEGWKKQGFEVEAGKGP
ncbi:MAG: MBL fold metallo-hydrolase [Planctomycetota bacterium]|nr:MBL fold metallo-hydrolase [Planctomycetota bacterium]